MMTPYEKLKSLPNAGRYLKPGMAFKQLDELAMKLTDCEAAKAMNKARAKLFQAILNDTKK